MMDLACFVSNSLNIYTSIELYAWQISGRSGMRKNIGHNVKQFTIQRLKLVDLLPSKELFY